MGIDIRYLDKDIGKTDEEKREIVEEIIKKELEKKSKKSAEEEEVKIKDSNVANEKKIEMVKASLIKKANLVRNNIKQMKDLKESMAREVLALEKTTKKTKEEIQVKELIFLDLTKKNEELKFQYQKYHKEYDKVLNERNDNVKKIQGAKQKKAEIKEKMKIKTTEMGILVSESEEIDNKRKYYKKEIKKIDQKQKALETEINKLEFEFKKHKEEIKRLTNENEKLHSILNNIEEDMVRIRNDYEVNL